MNQMVFLFWTILWSPLCLVIQKIIICMQHGVCPNIKKKKERLPLLALSPYWSFKFPDKILNVLANVPVIEPGLPYSLFMVWIHFECVRNNSLNIAAMLLHIDTYSIYWLESWIQHLHNFENGSHWYYRATGIATTLLCFGMVQVRCPRHQCIPIWILRIFFIHPGSERSAARVEDPYLPSAKLIRPLFSENSQNRKFEILTRDTLTFPL